MIPVAMPRMPEMIKPARPLKTVVPITARKFLSLKREKVVNKVLSGEGRMNPESVFNDSIFHTASMETTEARLK
jgi:hypothetical protein